MTNEKKVVMTIIDIIDEIKNKEQVILTSLLKELPQKQLALAENIKSDTVG
jgi:FixJ family two-component response regulator